MGSDVGRMATGIAYLDETKRVQEAELLMESDDRRRCSRAVALAKTLLEVGRQHHQQQDPGEAIKHYLRALGLVEQAIKVREEQADDASKKAVRYARFALSELCSGLGIAYNDTGRQDEALAMLQRALDLRKESIGKSHPSLAECYNNLGALLYAMGSLQRAQEHYEKALELLTQATGGRDEGAHVALTHYNIGLCQAGLGEMAAAGLALQRALKLAEAALGYDHPKVDLIKQTLEKGPPPAPPSATGTPDSGSP